MALHGALDLIPQAGGGVVVEAYPQDKQGQKISASVLYNGSRNLSGRQGSSINDRRARTIA